MVVEWTKASVVEALRAANTAPYTACRPSGCGRAYVCVSDKALAKVVAAACAELGLLYSSKGHYGTGPRSIYIGYDNADGRALAKSRAFAAVLTARGIGAYDDAVAD